MNKKFLSAILFGALMVTSTGTFVSCKDYDDDIKELNGRVDGVESQIKDLQAKINDGKWITNVTSVTGGFTVTFSDATSYTIVNGKDGAQGEAGAAGKDGAEWTITEDGFWACNGEKTTVKAVGQDGQDAQPEVKKENGKWYLWNGAEFEEIKVDAPAITGIPYYLEDVNDPNYVILVMFDENGGNKKEIRLPLTSGLGQIVVLKDKLEALYHTFNGVHFANGKATTWGGSKELPAKGEYLVTSEDAIYVQVVPANYDISKLNFKLVNTKGDVAPIVLGTPEPCTEAIASRANASESGVYAISFTLPEMTDEVIAAYTKNISGKALSLVANESVRSTYTYAAAIAKAEHAENVKFGKFDEKVAELDKPYTVKFTEETQKYVFDSFLTMKDAAAKADSVRYGITFDGMTISYTKEIPAGTTINFTINQLNARGIVNSAEIAAVTFGDKAETPSQNVIMTTTKHEAVAIKNAAKGGNKQYMDIDFKEYFDVVAPAEGDRLIWNEDMIVSTSVEILWTGVDEAGKLLAEEAVTRGLLGSAALLSKEDKPAANKDFAKLRIQFAENYGTQKLGNGTFRAIVRVVNNKDGKLAQTVEIPFTIANPTAAEKATWYSWDSDFFANGTLTKTVAKGEAINLKDAFKDAGVLATPAELNIYAKESKKENAPWFTPNMTIGYSALYTALNIAAADKKDEQADARKTMTWTGYGSHIKAEGDGSATETDITGMTSFVDAQLTVAAGADNKAFGIAYPISGIEVKAIGERTFGIDGINLVLKQKGTGKEDVITFSKALQIPSVQNQYIRLSNSMFAPTGNNSGKTFFGTFTLVDFTGKKYEITNDNSATALTIADVANTEAGYVADVDDILDVTIEEYQAGKDGADKAYGLVFKYTGAVEYTAGKTIAAKITIPAASLQLDGTTAAAAVTVPVTILVK